MDLVQWAQAAAVELNKVSDDIAAIVKGNGVQRSVLIHPGDAMGQTEAEAKELSDPNKLEERARMNRSLEDIDKKINQVLT